MDLPRISGVYYIPKPRIYERKSPRTKQVSYLEIVSQLPLQSPTDKTPEYIIVVAIISYARRFQLQHISERMRSIATRINLLNKASGEKHYFMYFIFNKATQGVYNTIKRLYATSNNAVVKPVNHSKASTIIQDIRRYIEARLQKILDPQIYRRSDGYIFSYLKRFVEYLLVLDALLANNEPLAQQIAEVIHETSQYPVTKYLDILNTIRNNKNQEEIRTPKPLSYPYI